MRTDPAIRPVKPPVEVSRPERAEPRHAIFERPYPKHRAHQLCEGLPKYAAVVGAVVLAAVVSATSANAANIRQLAKAAGEACAESMASGQSTLQRLSGQGFSVKQRARKSVFTAKQAQGRAKVVATLKNNGTSCDVFLSGLTKSDGDDLFSAVTTKLTQLEFLKQNVTGTLGGNLRIYVRGDTALRVDGIYVGGSSTVSVYRQR